MAVKKLKPTTPGQRHKVASSFEDITTSTPEKSLLKGKGRKGGRNNTGKMTMRNIGGGHKRRYRTIDFKRDKFGIPGKVASVEYDPYRTARIALINYADGEKRYIIAPKGIGSRAGGLSLAKVLNLKLEMRCTLSEIPMGTMIHNIELRPEQGAKMARSAGSYAQLVSQEKVNMLGLRCHQEKLG